MITSRDRVAEPSGGGPYERSVGKGLARLTTLGGGCGIGAGG